jgi:hypothetical protein
MDEGGWVNYMEGLVLNTSFGFLWFMMLAVWGGTASYITRIKKSQAAFSLAELIGEWTVSAFAGVMTAYICYEMGFSFYATAALAGVSGHMGGKAITLVEAGVEAVWKRWVNGNKG